MRNAVAPVAFAALAAANPLAQGVTSNISPATPAPANCQTSYDGTFQISTVEINAKRDLSKRQGPDGELLITLQDGVLMDADGRTGYVAANSQLQFDAPAQTGAIYTSGFAICPGNKLSIGNDDTWYQCLSGMFFNLYDDNVLDAEQCTAINIIAVGNGGAPIPSPSQTPSSMPAGQSTVGPPATMMPPVTQIPDGQIQAPDCTQIADGQIQCPSGVVPPPGCTQIGDGQIQCPTSVPAAPTSMPAAPAPPAGSAPAPAPPAGSAPAPAPPAGCTQIGDGQIQCPTGAIPMPSGNGSIPVQPAPSSMPPPATGAAATTGFSIAGLAAGVMAIAML